MLTDVKRFKRCLFKFSIKSSQRSDTVKKRYIRNEEGLVEIKLMSVDRCVVADEYFNHFHKIDVHDHYRQHGLGLEMAWRTTKWQHRLIATLLDMIDVDAYLIYKRDNPQKSHEQYLLQLIYELAYDN